MTWRLSVVAVAIAALSASAVDAEGCGNLNQACCDLLENNPNIGVCMEGACWEGTCMPCGIDGKPSCDSATPHHPH